MMRDRLLLFTVSAWIALTVVELSMRPVMPIDETRVLTVAWEMQQSGDYIVPHLNGATYSHKPPLLEWFIVAGWQVFGPVEWWARLIGPLAGLAMLLLTRRIAAHLWPEHENAGSLAAALLVSTMFFVVMTSMTLYDALLGACVLLALLGTLRAWRYGQLRDWVMVACGLGFGILAKGPVVLLHTLPVALLAPLWDTQRLITSSSHGSWKRWYLAVVLALLGGIAMALLWVVPAAFNGGQEYREAILWGQTAGRMTQAFAHARPWWWYMPLLIPLLLPWGLWPPLWRGVWQLRQRWQDAGTRLCVLWFGVTFVVLSMASGKQVHYLIPVFPAVALLLARFLRVAEVRPRDHWLPAAALTLLVAAAGTVLFLRHEKLPAWVHEAQPLWLVPTVLLGCGLLLCRHAAATHPQRGLILLGCAVTLSAHLTAGPALHVAYDIHPAARVIAQHAAEGDAVAWVGTYHGELNYFARLREPVHQLDYDSLGAWLAQHPRAAVVLEGKLEPASGATPLHRQVWRGGFLEVWEGATLRAHPELLRR